MVFYFGSVPVASVQQAQAMYAIAVAGGAVIQAEAIAGVIAQMQYMGV